MSRSFFSALALLCSLSANFAYSDTIVTVGVYEFPPIASVDERGEAQGLLKDLLAELSGRQSGVSFEIVHTSPQRRQMDFKAGLFDVMFFENPRWSWAGLPVEMTDPLLRDSEVYVALAKPDRDQSFFDHVEERNLLAISGYHYGFAGLSTNNEALRERFNIELSHSHFRNLSLIRADRPSVAEVAIVSSSFLATYLKNNPDQRDLFLISDKKDQEYDMHVVTRRAGPVSVSEIEAMLDPLYKDGTYQRLIQRYGLKLPGNPAD